MHCNCNRLANIHANWLILTVVFRVLQGPNVEEGGADPVQGHVDIRDGVEDDLSIQVLYKVGM